MVSTDNGQIPSGFDEELGSAGTPAAYGDHNDIPLLVKRKEGSKRLCFVSIVRKINWASRWAVSKKWIRVPLKIVKFVWITCAIMTVTTGVLFFWGLLNGAFPSKSCRDTWMEVNNQITNAIFTTICLYLHPRWFYYLVLLHQWQPEDKVRLREVYCKDGTEKPNERKHMLVVLILLHVNCFAQYAICGFTVGYTMSSRPVVPPVLCITVAISSALIAKSYTKRSPLGKEYDTEKDPKAQDQVISA